MIDHKYGAIVAFLGAYANFLTVVRFFVRRRRSSKRRWWVRPILRSRDTFGAYNTLFREMRITDEEEFFSYTRMSIAQFDKLHQLVEPFLRKHSLRKPLPSKLRLAATLSFLARGDAARSVAWNFRVGRSTIFKIIKETCETICRVLQRTHLPSPSDIQWERISESFWDRWNFPNCLGSIDGKHIRIQAPPNSGTNFHNYKGFFSFVLLAACDANYRFSWVDIGDYGSHNDAGIFRQSALGRSLEAGDLDIPQPKCLPGTDVKVPFSFVGDEAFPLKTYLMRPYSRRALVGDEQRVFNYRLSRARRVIENAFGILVSRWNVLRSPLRFSADTSQSIVLALVCLHNYVMSDDDAQNRGRYNYPGLVDEEGPNGEIIEGEWRRVNVDGMNFNRLGRVGANVARFGVNQQRDTLASYFVSAEGSVPWQWACIHR